MRRATHSLSAGAVSEEGHGPGAARARADTQAQHAAAASNTLCHRAARSIFSLVWAGLRSPEIQLLLDLTPPKKARMR